MTEPERSLMELNSYIIVYIIMMQLCCSLTSSYSLRVCSIPAVSSFALIAMVLEITGSITTSLFITVCIVIAYLNLGHTLISVCLVTIFYT